MKKPLPIIAIALCLVVSTIILISETYFYAYEKGYDQCIKDSCFTIYPANYITVDTVIFDEKLEEYFKTLDYAFRNRK